MAGGWKEPGIEPIRGIANRSWHTPRPILPCNNIKYLPITVIGRAKMMIPEIMAHTATSFPMAVTGTISPYPTVVMVTRIYQNVAGILHTQNQ